MEYEINSFFSQGNDMAYLFTILMLICIPIGAVIKIANDKYHGKRIDLLHLFGQFLCFCLFAYLGKDFLFPEKGQSEVEKSMIKNVQNAPVMMESVAGNPTMTSRGIVNLSPIVVENKIVVPKN
jgi:hypothetical protein